MRIYKDIAATPEIPRHGSFVALPGAVGGLWYCCSVVRSFLFANSCNILYMFLLVKGNLFHKRLFKNKLYSVYCNAI